MEREQTAERTKTALAVSAKNRWRTQSGSSTVKRGDAELVEDADEQATLRQMLALRERARSLTAIAATLNANGTTTRRGSRWSPQLVHKMLAAYDAREACLV